MSWALLLPLAGVAVVQGGADPAAPAPLVVLDPGHGGENAGAPGVSGVHEKEVTLAVARRTARYLESRGIRCVLTRDDDRYLTLRQRTRIANEYRADVFMSIHANSSGTGSSRGFETHVLSRRGAMIDAPALRGIERSPRPGLDADLAAVIAAVERDAAIDEAADLAVMVQDELRPVRGGEHDRGVRQDAHHVLLGATMPSVLVEIGFMDHPVEGPELYRSESQERIAAALARAIAAFVSR